MRTIYTPDRKGQNWRGAVTHCLRGHPYDEENTIWRDYGNRLCRTCERARNREYYRRKKAG